MIFELLQLFILSAAAYPNWDKLSVTWKKFSTLPMNEQEAKQEGWTLQVDGCTGGSDLFFMGKQYTLNGDTGTLLLFGENGHVIGIQMAMSNTTEVAASALANGPFLHMDGKIYLTAYFTDPLTACGAQEDIVEESKVVGDKLLLQVKPLNRAKLDENTNTLLELPLREKDIGSTMWTKGKCFYSMGQHYWYDISRDMNCEDFFPMFLLYNGGDLNGFGWATSGQFDSPRVEHPPSWALKMFFPDEVLPQCLYTEVGKKGLTTQHVFLERRPYFNYC